MQADFEEIMAKKEVSYDEIRQLSSQRLEKYDGKSLIENMLCIWEWCKS